MCFLPEKHELLKVIEQKNSGCKRASLIDNTGSMPITFDNEMTKQLKAGKCYEIIEVKITKYMTQRLLKQLNLQRY